MVRNTSLQHTRTGTDTDVYVYNYIREIDRYIMFILIYTGVRAQEHTCTAVHVHYMYSLTYMFFSNSWFSGRSAFPEALPTSKACKSSAAAALQGPHPGFRAGAAPSRWLHLFSSFFVCWCLLACWCMCICMYLSIYGMYVYTDICMYTYIYTYKKYIYIYMQTCDVCVCARARCFLFSVFDCLISHVGDSGRSH